jgi:hypothetical protein
MLIGATYGVCVLFTDLLHVGEIVLSDRDPHRSEGPIEEIVGISMFGTAALVVAVVLLLWLGRTPTRARGGAFLLAGLGVVTLPFFWSGAPGIFGAAAAACAGVTRGRQPVEGRARTAGTVGVVLALLNVVSALGGTLLTVLGG